MTRKIRHTIAKDIHGPKGACRGGGFGFLDGDRWRLQYKTAQMALPPSVTRDEANLILESMERVYEDGHKQALMEVREALGIPEVLDALRRDVEPWRA